MEFVKPAGTSEVTPVTVSERAPTTSFDEDLHQPRSGDTYETICREFYNDPRYAAALQAYNGNRPLAASVIAVPPIHILKKRFPQLVGATAAPVGRSADGWGPAGSAGAASPVFRASGAKTFTVPAGGTTLRSVAREALGNPNKWQEIYDLNPQVTPDNVPAGTVLRLPDARPN
jgi:nucleoid-associated protein YgaU